VTSSDRHLMHETLSLRELRLFPIGYACGGRLCCVSLAPPKFQCSRDIVLLLAVIAHPLKNPTTRHQSITPRLSNLQTPSKGRLSVEQPESVPQSRDINNTPSTACGVSNHYTHLRAPLIYHNVVDTDIVCTAEDWRSLDATSIIAVEKGGAWRDSTRNIKYQRLVRCLTNRDRGGIWRVLRSWQVRLSLFVIQSGIDRDTTFSWPARRVSWWSWVTDTS